MEQQLLKHDSLRSEVKALIEKYRSSIHGTQDRFTTEEFVAMAAHRPAKHTLWTYWTTRGLPIRMVHVPSDSTYHNVMYAADITASRLLLRDRLAPHDGVFGLMDLPPELRLKIYDFVFALLPLALPGRGKDFFSVPIWVVNNDVDMEGTFPRFAKRFGYLERRSPSFNDLSAFALVNKEVSEEAMPRFYAVNNFVIGDISKDGVFKFIRIFPSKQLEHLAHPSIIYKYAPILVSREAVKAFELLEDVNHLKMFLLEASDAGFFTLETKKKVPAGAAPDKRFKTPAALPAMAGLCGLLAKTKKYTILGVYPVIRSYIDGVVVELRKRDKEERTVKSAVENKVATSSRKRKAAGGA